MTTLRQISLTKLASDARRQRRARVPPHACQESGSSALLSTVTRKNSRHGLFRLPDGSSRCQLNKKMPRNCDSHCQTKV